MLKFCPGAGVRSAKYEVNPGSKAAQKGVREGDVISSINGQPTKHVTNSAAHSLLRNAGHTLRLGLNQENCGSPKRRGHKSSQSADQEQQSARSEERTRGRSGEEVCVEAGEGASKDPATTSQGQQQSTAMVGNSRSRRRKRARANRLKNQAGERPEISALASEDQFVAAESSEVKTEVQQSDSTGEFFEEGVQEMALAGNETEDTYTFPLLHDAGVTLCEAGPDYVVNSDHDSTSVEASSKSICSESSCGSRTETVSSYLSIVYTSVSDYENQNAGSVTAVDDAINTIPCDSMQLQLNVFSSDNDAASNGKMDIENDLESEQNAHLSGIMHENDGHGFFKMAVTCNEGTKKQELYQHVIGFEDQCSSQTDISEGHQITDTVKECTGDEERLVQQNVVKVEIKESNAKQEYYSNSLVTEQHSIDCESNDSRLLQNDLVVNALATTDLMEIIPSPKGTGEEEFVIDKLEILCSGENGTAGKHTELDGPLGKCSLYEDFSAEHIIDTGNIKSATCETKTNDNSICIIAEPQEIFQNENKEEHNLDTTIKSDNVQSFENHCSAGQIIDSDEVRNIPYENEEATACGEAELNNYFLVQNEDKHTVDYGSEVDGSFQRNSAVLCITDTDVAHCDNVSEEKNIQCNAGKDHKFCEEGRETFKNNVVSLHEINADVNKTIRDQEYDERKIVFKETENQNSNGQEEYVAPNKCDDKGTLHDDAETEHISGTVIAKAGLCQNETKENLNKPEQGIFHSENRDEQILDNISDVPAHQDHCTSVCIVTTKAVFCANETQEKGTTRNTSGEQEGHGIELGSEHRVIAGTKSTLFCETDTGRNVSCESSDEQVACQNENTIHATNAKCVDLGPLHTISNETTIVNSGNMDFYQYSNILEKNIDIKTDCRDTFQKETTHVNENGSEFGISVSQNEFKEERQYVDNIEVENILEVEIMENSGHVNEGSFGTSTKVSDGDDNLEALQCDSKGRTSQEFIAPAKNERTKINTSEKLDPLQMQKVNEWCAEGEVTAERDRSSSSVKTSEIFEDRTNFQKENCISEIVSTVETHSESCPPELLVETGLLKCSECNKMESHSYENGTSNYVAHEEDNSVASEDNFRCIDSHKYITLSSEENNRNNAVGSMHFTEVFENKLNEVEWETTVENGKIGTTEVESICIPCFALKTSTVSLQQNTSSEDSKTPEKNIHMQPEDDALHTRKNLHVDGSKESASSKRFRTRQILESFFMPSNHQRYLDVIVEEGGESNEEKESAERSSLRPQNTENTDKVEDSDPQLVICKKYSGDIFTWSCSRHSKDECNSKNSKHSIVWEKSNNKNAKIITYPQQNIGCDAEVESNSEEELILKRGKMQEAEENAEVVFLEDTSSTSSMTIQGDDPGDDADIEEIELEFRDYGADDKIRTSNMNSHSPSSYKNARNHSEKYQSSKQFTVDRETNEPKNTTFFDDPVYENILVFRKSNSTEDFKSHSSSNRDLHSRMNSGEQFVHWKPNYMHAPNLQGSYNISASSHTLIPDVNAPVTEKMGTVKKNCDNKNDGVSSSDAQGTDFNRAGTSTDNITNKGSHSEKIVDFFKHLFISLPETDVRRMNVHEALMELICDASSPLSPVTRNGLEILLSDESFNTSEGHAAYENQTSSGEHVVDISSAVKGCTSINNSVDSHQTNLVCQISSETDVSNPENGSTEPKSLKDLALDRILSLPYGTEILICLGIKGIHMYSQNISVGRGQRRFSKSVAPRASPHVINLNQRMPTGQFNESTWNGDTGINDYHDEERVCTPVVSESCGQEWVGMPTSLDPHLLVCMSPSQARGYRGHYMLPTPEEAQSLLDLHKKYMERHSYHDKHVSSRHVAQIQTPPLADGAVERRDSTHHKQGDGEPAFIVNPSREKECVTSRAVKIPAEEGEGARVGEMESSRLLAIIRESSPRRAPPCQQTPAGMEPVVARGPKAANRHSWAGPQLDRPAEKRSSAFLDSLDDSLRLSDDSRLKAKLLSEWMSLARERGGSSTSPSGDVRREETDTHAPAKENGHERPPTEEQRVFTGARRHSLPEPGDQPCQPPQLARQVSAPGEPRRFDPEQYIISKRGDIAIIQSEARPGRAKALAASGGDGEIFRQQMYLEYMSKVEERKERRRQKVIRISAPPPAAGAEQDQGRPRLLQSEFMGRVRERMDKLGLDYGGEEEGRADAPPLPRHLHEFLASDDEAAATDCTPRDLLHEIDDQLVISRGFLLPRTGVWSPAQKDKEAELQREQEVPAPSRDQTDATPPSAAVWTPRSAGSSPVAERKEFRPVKFQSPTLPRKSSNPPAHEQMKQEEVQTQQKSSSESPVVTLSDLPSSRLVQSHSAPASGLSSLVSLPRAQNPTITLLQKAREGQLPKGALYLENNSNNNEDKSSMNPNDILFQVKREYETDTDGGHKKVTELTPKKYDGIGPMTREGIPLVLRSEIKETNQAKWYKRMYDSLHRASKDDDYVTVRYRPSRGSHPSQHTSPGGYMSEPDRSGYYSDVGYSAKYATLDRRRIKNKENDFTTNTLPRSKYLPHPNSVKGYPEVYRNQPGRIEDYVPGRSSISDKETKQWWDEVLEIFDSWLASHYTQLNHSSLHSNYDIHYREKPDGYKVPVSLPGNSFLNRAVKVSGYDSDSTLVFKRRDENLQNQLSPAEQKMAYKTIQKGGEVPLHGLRKPAPERPKEISEIEYFPISPHLTRIRVHRQNVTPLREIFCYPILTHMSNNPPPLPPTQAFVPPVFSTFKRTAPSHSPAPKRPPPPPRVSSHNNSTLRLWSGVKLPASLQGQVRSSRHEACFSHTTKSSLPFKLTSDRASRRAVHEASTFRKPVKTQSASPVSARVSSGTVFRSRSSPDNLPSHKPGKSEGQLGVQKVRQSPSRLSRSPDLTSPSQVRKALQKQKETRERLGSPVLPPGTVVKSSTALYSSARNGLLQQPHEQKSLRVTVAISAKGRELLKSTAKDSQKQSAISSPSMVIGDSTLKSPSVIHSAVPKAKSKVKGGILLPNYVKNSNKITESLQVSKTVKSLTKNVMMLVNDEGNKRSMKSDVLDVGKRQKGKTVVSVSKVSPTAVLKSSVKKAICSASNTKKSEMKEEKKNDTKKAKKTKSDALEPSGRSSPVKRINGSIKRITRGKNGHSERLDKKHLKTDSLIQTNHPVCKTKTISTRPIDEDTSQFGSFGDLSPSKLVDGNFAPLKTYSFFQHLFLRDMPSPTQPTSNSLCRSSSVLEKARQFHDKVINSTMSRTDSHMGLLNVYLSQKRPVTESKFRELDRKASASSRSPSPRALLPRQLMPFMNRNETTAPEDTKPFASTLSSRSRTPDSAVGSVKQRSSSEPPLPASNIKQGHHEQSVGRLASSTEHLQAPAANHSPSSRKIRGARGLAARPIESVSGVTHRHTARARSAGEVELRQAVRHRLSPESTSSHAQSTSSLNLPKITDHAEYQSYVMELIHSARKSERFKELHKFYSSLERMGQLERATSSSDLRPRLKGEEVIDYDRWKKLRAMERAEGELKVIYKELREAQKEKGLFFRPKDAETLKWKGEVDRGLRCREKSVEDIKQQLKRLADEDSELESLRKRDLALKKDVYKPLWRGSSVLDLASNIDTPHKRYSRTVTVQTSAAENLPSPSFSKHFQGIGTRLWSSLSMEQVNALKSQLSEIYSPDKNLHSDKDSVCGPYEIEVLSKKGNKDEDALHVRCNSLLTRDQLYSPVVRRREALRTETMKADSISSLPFCKRKTCKFKDNTRPATDKKQTNTSKPLSETEKKKLSHTLSKEVLDKVTRQGGKSPSSSSTSSRKRHGSVSATAVTKSASPPPTNGSPVHSETVSPRTCYSLEMSEDDAFSDKHASASLDNHSKNDFLLVLTPLGQQQKEVEKVVEGWANSKAKCRQNEKDGEVTAQLVRTTSASETESASSETSTRTVIHVGSKEEIRQKVNFFENQASSHVLSQRVCRSASDVCPTRHAALTSTGRAKSAPGSIPTTSSTCAYHRKISPRSEVLHSSQSYSDLKEIFGEQNRFKYTTVAVRRCESPSPVRTSPLVEPSTSRGSSSCESLLRHSSPDPSRYWRAYLRLAKHGDVKKLRHKFESLEDLSWKKKTPSARRYRSDPELARNLLVRHSGTIVKGHEMGDVSWLRKKYEGCGRGRSRVKKGRIVSPVPLKVEDRMMPHINIISKLASLQQRSSTVPCQRQTPEPSEFGQLFHHGDVKRIREIFERMSILGQMFTSAPDVHELKDIRPYLECDWIAHRYPDTKPSRAVRHQSPIPAPPAPKSPQPEQQQPRQRQEQQQQKRDVFADQQFDPSIHRPLFRYQPPRSPALAHWWHRQAAAARPTVTFKEPVNGAVPGKSHTGDRPQESPHRYVESEVTIHYRSPVRSEAKQAVSEEELARRQAEAMRRIYQEERRRKYLQELQDMNSRRHTDNFTPSQKSPIPLNRYDDILDDVSKTKPRDRTPEPKLVARALYNFVGQTSRELSFRRGDIIFVKRQIDKNWYEGEHNAMVGLFPLNYVEIIPYDGIRTMPKRPSEGQARAKFNFTAQTYLELPLVKGELVVLTRRVDDNWYEGRIGSRKGIFPVSYVEVLQEPGMGDRPVSRAVSSPASQMVMVNGSRGGRPATYQPGSYYGHSKGVTGHYATLPRQGPAGKLQSSAMNQTLHIDTRSEPVPYRALYNYCPQNDDELELMEGDLVYVMEKCDDGWYVGSSQRTGYFGTFPGNYVERI